MLEVVDRIVLAAGVRIEPGCVVDDVRGSRLPVNETAEFVLARVGRSLGDVAVELAVAYDLHPVRARDDVLAFAFRLNRFLLVNVERGRGRSSRLRSWLRAVLHLAPSAALPRSP